MVPTFIFQVEYDFTAGILTVHIVKCEDLPAMDIGGTSDPYVKIYLLPERKRKYETKVHRCVPGLYMIGYGTRKIILKLPPF